MIVIALAFVTNILAAIWTWPADMTSEGSIHQFKYRFEENARARGLKAFQGPVSGNIYQTGNMLYNNPNATFIIKFSDLNTVLWSQFFENIKLSRHSFWTDSNEAFVYFIQIDTSQTYSFFYGLHTDNGTIAMTKRIHDSGWANQVWHLRASNDGSLIGSVYSYSYTQGLIFRYNPINDTLISYLLFGAKSYPRVFTYLYNSRVFMTNHAHPDDHVLIAIADLNSMTYKWYKNMTCAYVGSWTKSYYSYAVYNKEDDTIYLGQSENNIILFYSLNATDGSVIMVYRADDFERLYDGHFHDPQTLLISAKRSSDKINFILIYNISNTSFTEYKSDIPNIFIMSILPSIQKDRLILYGYFGLDT